MSNFNWKKHVCVGSIENQTKIIVHLVFDDKFIDMAYREFETVAPNKNIFIIIGKNRPLQYIKSANVIFLSVENAINLIDSDLCSAVILHSLNPYFTRILEVIPETKKLIWLGWGYDYYEQLLLNFYPNGLLLSQTASLIQQKPKSISQSFVFLKPLKNFLKPLFIQNKLLSSIIPIIEYPSNNLLHKINYFCPVIDIEHKMALEANSWFSAKYIPWNYGTLEDDLIIDSNKKQLANNILVGNSATEENNHLEAFTIIHNKIDYSSRKIIVPLSYGDDWYKDKIIKHGYNLFGSSFFPLTTFMNNTQYIEIISSCGYVFMNHLRQQALGNICIMMSIGSKIYMNEASPLYHWLKTKGGLINSINSLEKDSYNQHILSPLTDVEQEQNVKVILNHWGRDIQRKKTKYLIDVALGYI